MISLASGLRLPLTQPANYTLTQTFNDGSEVPEYGRTVVAAATERGLVVNYPDVRFLRPNASATRAEIAAFLVQALLKPGESSPVSAQYRAQTSLVPAPVGEIRGVWLTNIDSNVLYYPETLTQAINLLAELNINTLYPVVWNRGYTLYPSAVMERLIGTKIYPISLLEDRNILNEIIPQARAKNMSVIPWFEFGFMVPQSSKIIQTRRHWMTQRQDGSFLVPETEGSTNMLAWLNPFHPQVQQFMLDLVLEVVRNYDIEGIQIDDHFGLPVELGYDPFTIQLYRREHDGKTPPPNFRDPEWIAWRANKITDFIMRLFWMIKEYKPRYILSLSPNTQAFSYNNYLQDWHTWEQSGYLEEIVMQVYRNNLESFSPDLQRPEVLDGKIHVPFGIGILTGLRDRPAQLSMVEAQVQETRDRRFAGVAFFFYESLRVLTSTATGKAEFQALFPSSTARPKIVNASIPARPDTELNP
ncbi:MAG: family 10 glycosylhydrolase [Oscillatoriales cyanobacterium SM2_3_0]|nr:family 10 glycosylhydrolase [Oscillatoriales cyanobacterium SM2_3_0]